MNFLRAERLLKMGVYIPELKIPKNCVSCPLCIKYQVSCTYCNLLEADLNPKSAKEGRSKNCPLIEISSLDKVYRLMKDT